MTEDGTQSDTSHKFLKVCIGKQIQQGLEWDDLVWKATEAYNFFPTESFPVSHHSFSCMDVKQTPNT